MKKSKKIISLIFIFILLLIISLFVIINKVHAHSTTFYRFMTKYPSYDYIKDVDPKELSSYQIWDGSGDWWQKEHQILCFHYSNTTDGTVSEPLLVLDINSDGNSPNEVKIYNAKTGELLETNRDYLNSGLAYIATKCEEGGTSTWCDGTYNSSFQKYWNQIYLNGNKRKDFLQKCGILFANDSSDSYKDGAVNVDEELRDKIMDEALNYVNNYDSSEKVYQARIIICSGGSMQARGIVYGKEIDNPEKIIINKYIKSVEYEGLKTDSDGNNYGVENLDSYRSNLSEEEKSNNPVVVKHSNVKIHYEITIKNETNRDVEGIFTDELLGNKNSIFEITEIKLDGEDFTNGSTIKIGNTTRTFSVTVEGSYSAFYGKLENKATFKSTLTEKIYVSSDWLEVIPEEGVKIDKFITRVEDLQNDDSADIVLGEERKGRDDSDKQNSPVETAHGNVKVHYKIVITKTGSIPISNGQFTDEYDNEFLSTNNDLNRNIEIDPSKSREYTIELSLYGNPNIQEGEPYENKAIISFISTTEIDKENHKKDPIISTSSDYIDIIPKGGQTINKTIAEINGKTLSREGMSEEEKQKNIVDAGTNEDEKKIVYKITINNIDKEEVTGKFYDEADKGIIINSMVDENGRTIENGGTLTFKESTTITVTTTIKAQELPGIYRNTSRFEVDGTRRVIESSDYFELKPVEEKPTGIIKKYIIGIESANDRENSTSEVFKNVYSKDNRNEKNSDWL